MRRAAGAVALALLALLAAGCGDGGDDVDARQARVALEQQRDDVRALARELVAPTEQAIAGTVTTAAGRWEGCDSAFNDVYRNYRYSTQVRLDAPSGDLLGPLASVVEQAGLAREPDDQEPDRLRATRDGLSVSFWQLPDATTGALLITIRGECVDVPADEREEWLHRGEPDPNPLA